MTYNPYTNTYDFPEKSDVPEPLKSNGQPYSIFEKTSPAYKVAVQDGLYKMVMAWMQKYNIPQSVLDEWNAAQLANINTDKSWWEKVKEKVQNIPNVVKQDLISIKEGLGKSPAEILADLKKEAIKSGKDLKGNVPAMFNVLNKLNPVAVAGRTSLLGLLEMNAFGMATHFSVLRSDSDLWPKALKRWSMLGGDPAVFSSSITKGKNKPRLFEGVLKMLHRNADGSFNASAEEIQQAVAATAQAQKEYDEAVKKNKGTNVAATSLGVIAASTAAIGSLLSAGIFGPQGIPAGPPTVAGGGTLASFIPIINQMKIKVGEKPDNSIPEADPILDPRIDPPGPTTTPDGFMPTASSSSLTKWIVGGLLITGLSIGIYKYATK